MENQHRLIDGYRELDEDTIKLMNRVKRLEKAVLILLDRFAAQMDPRWRAIAKTEIQKAFMAVGRAIARPDGYCPECEKSKN